MESTLMQEQLDRGMKQTKGEIAIANLNKAGMLTLG